MAAQFTDRELDLMVVLWDRGASTVAEVRDALTDDLAHTTVHTMLGILVDKGFAERVEEGRGHRYRAIVAREDAGTSAVRRVIDKLFGGSRELLLTHLARDASFSESEARKLRALLDEAEKGAETSGGKRRGRKE